MSGESRPLPVDLGHRVTSSCDWCGAPATTVLHDQSRRRLSSGTVVSKGSGTRFAVCSDCKERLEARYLKGVASR